MQLGLPPSSASHTVGLSGSRPGGSRFCPRRVWGAGWPWAWLTHSPLRHSGAGVRPGGRRGGGGHGDGRGCRLPAEPLQSLHPVLYPPPGAGPEAGPAAAGKCGLSGAGSLGAGWP